MKRTFESGTNQNFQNRISRRTAAVGGLIAATSVMLTGCGEKETVVIVVPEAEYNKNSATRPTEQATEKVTPLDINVDELPYDEDAIWADREHLNPARYRDIIEDGSTGELRTNRFIEAFETVRDDIFTNQEFDYRKAGNRFLNLIVPGIHYSCVPETLKQIDPVTGLMHIEIPNDGRYADEMAKDDLNLVRAICGLPKSIAEEDEEVRSTVFYKEFSAARWLVNDRFIRGAQLANGNLNQSLDFVNRRFEHQESFDGSADMVAIAFEIKSRDVAGNPPADPIQGTDKNGYISVVAYHDYDPVTFNQAGHGIGVVSPLENFVDAEEAE